jgi:hypothetical protein
MHGFTMRTFSQPGTEPGYILPSYTIEINSRGTMTSISFAKMINGTTEPAVALVLDKKQLTDLLILLQKTLL